jgi:hypothetical protein
MTKNFIENGKINDFSIPKELIGHEIVAVDKENGDCEYFLKEEVRGNRDVKVVQINGKYYDCEKVLEHRNEPVKEVSPETIF